MKRKNTIRAITLNCYNCGHEFEHLIPGMSSIESSRCSHGECPKCACDFEVEQTRGMRPGKREMTSKLSVVFKV